MKGIADTGFLVAFANRRDVHLLVLDQNQSITSTANTSVWGISGCSVVADTFKKSVNYNCGSTNCSQSAYVQDNCSALNYCFK